MVAALPMIPQCNALSHRHRRRKRSADAFNPLSITPCYVSLPPRSVFFRMRIESDPKLVCPSDDGYDASKSPGLGLAAVTLPTNEPPQVSRPRYIRAAPATLIITIRHVRPSRPARPFYLYGPLFLLRIIMTARASILISLDLT